VLVEPMASLSDLALGLVTLYLARRLPRGAAASRYWHAVFVWAAVAALAGAVHHAVLVGDPRVARVSWAVVSSMVVVVMSFLLAASVVEVLGRSRAVVFWPLRLAGLLAYAVFAATGHASIAAIMWCESLTVAGVLALWTWAAVRRHPLARPMLIAIGASIGAAMFRLVPGAAGLLGLDPNSAYHLGQIVGMVLLFHAVAGTRTGPVLRSARG
jgi:hypothetical protein